MNELNKTPPVMETKLPARSNVLAGNLTSPPAQCFTRTIGWSRLQTEAESVMSRVALVLAAAGVMGSALAGCSDSSSSWPAWLTPKQSAPPLQTLHFQSAPPGANVRTAKGQTCQTPCSLAVSPESQSVTFEKDGFTPQTVQVAVAEQTEHSFFARDPPPALRPNPVDVALQAEPKPAKKPAERKAAVHAAHRQTPNSPARKPEGMKPPPQQ
jgi:PEGA domain